MIDKHRNVLLVSLKLVIPNFAPFEVERPQLSEIPLQCTVFSPDGKKHWALQWNFFLCLAH